MSMTTQILIQQGKHPPSPRCATTSGKVRQNGGQNRGRGGAVLRQGHAYPQHTAKLSWGRGQITPTFTENCIKLNREG